VYLSVDLDKQNALRMRCIIICSLPRLQYIPKLSLKRQDFRKTKGN